MLWFAWILACGAPPDAASPVDSLDPIVRAVAQKAGNPYEVPALTFTFLVRGPEGELVRRAHTWCPAEARATVKTGDDTVALDLNNPGTSDAYAAHINDAYWLFAPSKVADPGVIARASGNQLTLAFEGVGLTPGDQYVLTLDDEKRVTSWSFTLQSGRTGVFAWLDYQQVGPLLLSTRRISDDGREIAFEDVAALDRCPLD